MSKTEYRNWRLESDLDDVCWLTLDRAGESANSLSREVLTELEEIVTHLERNHPRGLVLQSGKPGSFIVGADVREFDQASSIAEAEGFIRDVHALFDRVEALPFPRVVTIDGYCLGGGLELALACDITIATHDCRFGSPEVLYGSGAIALLLPYLCGPKRAKEILLTGTDRITCRREKSTCRPSPPFTEALVEPGILPRSSNMRWRVPCQPAPLSMKSYCGIRRFRHAWKSTPAKKTVNAQSKMISRKSGTGFWPQRG